MKLWCWQVDGNTRPFRPNRLNGEIFTIYIKEVTVWLQLQQKLPPSKKKREKRRCVCHAKLRRECISINFDADGSQDHKVLAELQQYAQKSPWILKNLEECQELIRQLHIRENMFLQDIELKNSNKPSMLIHRSTITPH